MDSAILPRSIASSVVTALADTPAVVVNGPRQSGKTTLIRGLRYPGSVEIVTLDDPAARAAAAFDPRAFVERVADTLAIDEAQLEPRLFRAIKATVDADRRPGRFLLTGSSRLLAAPDMADALVGRVEIIELWPFAERELAAPAGPSFIDIVFDQPAALLRGRTMTRGDVIERALRGGFPEAIKRQPARRGAWFGSYVRTLTERVIRDVADLQRPSEMPRLLRLCAARTGTELNTTALANELAIPARTVSGYLAHLTSAFMIWLVPAWSTNLSAKVVRRPKLMLTDSGLAAHLQGVTAQRLEHPDGPLGPLMETFVATELLRQLSWSTTRAALFHFRDRSGIEVDLLLEHPDGRVVGIEVKATGTPRTDHLRGLRFLADRLGDRFTYGCLLTTAPEATPFGGKLAALPISALWDS
ncbi:MAG: ATP-binding protein [Egibacteraceae bacterium]